MNPVLREIQEIEGERAALARLEELRRWRRTEAPRQWSENTGYGSEVTAVICAVAHVFGVPFPKLLGKGRDQAVVEARMLAMKLLREDLDLPFSLVAEIFAKRTHGTVLYACHQIKRWMEKDKVLKARVARVRELLKEHEQVGEKPNGPPSEPAPTVPGAKSAPGNANASTPQRATPNPGERFRPMPRKPGR
jgi:hypothetical protein